LEFSSLLISSKATRPLRFSPGKCMISAKSASKSPELSQVGDEVSEDLDMSILSDDSCPVDRRVVNQYFQVVLSRYKLDKTKFAEAAGVSGATISKLSTSESPVSWATWESVLSGLIKFHPNAAFSFWAEIPIRTLQSIKENTGNRIILNYIAETEKNMVKNVDAAAEAINRVVDQVGSNSIDDQFLSKIKLPRLSQHLEGIKSRHPGSGTQIISSGSANFYNGTVTNLTLLVLPNGTDPQSAEMSDLISHLLRGSSMSETDKSTNS
jgi:hypothetical protein